jgi:hypothetical protein
MANIIRQWDATDGHYVRVESAGEQLDLRFSAGTPTSEELADKITTFEQLLTDEIVAHKIIESEEIDHGLRFI